MAEPAPTTPATSSDRAALNAADALLNAGDADAASAIAVRLAAKAAAGGLADALHFDLRMLEARIAAANGDVDGARQLLRQMRPFNAAQRANRIRFAARLDAEAGLPAQAAARLANLDADAVDNPASVVATLWAYALRAPASAMATQHSAPGTTAAAWQALLMAYNDALTPRQQRNVWEQWRAAHPNHIAARAEPPLASAAAMPGRIALLLPLSGPLEAAARAVRDGFLAAYLASAPPPWQTVRIYDTDAASVEALYAQALADDAALVVGPLAKEATRRLWALPAGLPVLALNTVPASAGNADPPPSAQSAQRIQFALAAEDDGRAIGRRLSADGARRVALFRGGAWSERAATALRTGLGPETQVVAAGMLQDIKDVTTNVAQTLGVVASSERHRALAQHFGSDVEFTARRRQDVDAVAALVEADYLPSLRRALAFHFAADVPIYASAQALRTAGGGRELDGARVCGMPWQLQPPRAKATLQGAFDQLSGAMEALFAFGVDAFRIANQLEDFHAGAKILGGAGVLTLGQDGVVRRELACAAVRGDRLEPLAAAAQ